MPSTTLRPGRANPRRRARELVLQGLYQRRVSRNDAGEVRLQLAESPGYERADAGYFDELWRGLADDADAVVERLAPLLDRPPSELSPIERAILAIGAWELEHRQDIPYRVVINEAVELAKSYGGTDGHKFVNGVLDRHAASVRAAEIGARARERNAT
jgi:N utilization substance protein B